MCQAKRQMAASARILIAGYTILLAGGARFCGMQAERCALPASTEPAKL